MSLSKFGLAQIAALALFAVGWGAAPALAHGCGYHGCGRAALHAHRSWRLPHRAAFAYAAFAPPYDEPAYTGGLYGPRSYGGFYAPRYYGGDTPFLAPRYYGGRWWPH